VTERERIMLKLIAVAPATRAEAIRDTGWPHAEADAAIEALLARGELAYLPAPGNCGTRSRHRGRLCLPGVRGASLGRHKVTR